MTGFARRERAVPAGNLVWEIRTVNHRFLEVSVRLPEEFRSAENRFRQAIAGAVRRGKTECALSFRPAAGTGALDLDAALIESLAARARQIAELAGPAGRIGVVDLLRWPGVVCDTARNITPVHEAAQTLLLEALAELDRFRASEGARLQENLEQRCSGVLDVAARVAGRLPEVRARMHAKLRERIAEIVAAVDHDRLEQELAILAQRLDVDEELDRLRGHVAEIRKSFAANEPAGRRLDFLMQELNREANTLSSKSQDLETTRAAVDMKVLIEQMREQVQNIE
ncbi:MAG TPA: YicC/YloC family endoribonuclease [Steroidobacteraceae bacterium]|nr:YicC/YloC family endoribonuclease [Steroidobacteraceae bacterium]